MNREDVQCFIFSWPKVKKLAVELYHQLEQVVDTVVVNSGEENLPGIENCLNIGEDAYFTEQINEMLNFMQKSEKMISYSLVADTKLIQGNYGDAIDAALLSYDYIKWGMYSLEGKGRPIKREFSLQHMPGVHEIPLEYPADLGHCFTHRKVLKSGPLSWDVNLTKFGWGIDILYSNRARKKGWPVVRDFNFPIFHLQGTGYDLAEAWQECIAMLEHYGQKK